MINRLIFKVERKSGKMPDITWSVVFERELEIDSTKPVFYSDPGHEDVIKVLRYLYPDCRVSIIFD